MLFVDDEPGLCDLAKEYLEASGDFRVRATGNAGDALNALANENFDVVVADYFMPGTTGIDLLKKVREKGNEIPFIIFTGKGSQKVAIEALNLGADYYLKKGRHPRTQLAVLRERIEHAVKARTSGHSLTDLVRIVQAIPDPACLFDRDGRIAEWNVHMQKLTGLPAESMRGRADHRLAEVLFGSARPILADLVLAPGELQSRYYSDIRTEPDGGMTARAEAPPGSLGARCEEHVRVYLDDRNTLTGIVEVVRVKGSTEDSQVSRKQAESVRTSPRIVIDSEGTILSITHSARVLSGTEGKEVKNIREILHAQSHPALESDLKTLEKVPIGLISEYVMCAPEGMKRVTARLSRTIHEGRESFAVTLKHSERY
ncbi:CheY-like chemotaxis protein [Methanolinea mesophila]|uniref:response regulator n=1 Tax=Methanolinea mesophila TaxID=547055 RepID=UPI001AE48A82|nr:CheY-like chemotaxis protein [Methanolinea mesophila]